MIYPTNLPHRILLHQHRMINPNIQGRFPKSISRNYDILDPDKFELKTIVKCLQDKVFENNLHFSYIHTHVEMLISINKSGFFLNYIYIS